MQDALPPSGGSWEWILPVGSGPRIFSDPDLLVFGLVCQLLGAAFLFSSIGRGRPTNLVNLTFRGASDSLGPLRNALHAKVRGHAAAFFFLFSATLLLAAMVLPAREGGLMVQGAGAAGLVLVAGSFALLLDGWISRAMRNHLRDHFRKHPFLFEDHIALTREVGDLFGVPSNQEDTLEAYVARVRKALGLQEPARQPFGPPE